ncbi:MAG: hypothetical protein ACI83W_000792 [Marinoscillum sp.]|jgi:hypothetical protein
MKSLIYKIGLSLGLLLTIALPLLAQGAPPATPIDGGLSLLLIAGGAYGAKKLYSKRK